MNTSFVLNICPQTDFKTLEAGMEGKQGKAQDKIGGCHGRLVVLKSLLLKDTDAVIGQTIF